MAEFAGSGVITVNKGNTSYNSRGTISVLADGGWLITWEDDSFEHSGSFQQRYDAEGNRVGGETQVQAEIGSQPVGLSDGGWLSLEATPLDNGVTDSLFFQRYDKDGHAVGESTLINDYVPYVDISWGRATELAGGGWIATWLRSAGMEKNDIRQQQFDADGNKVGSETEVSSDSNWYQGNSEVIALQGGGWVVTWTDRGDKDSGIYQRVYDAEGEALGAEQRIHKYRPYELPSYYDAIATKDGGWLLAWNEYDEQQGSNAIFQQHYDSQGNATGALAVTDVALDAAYTHVVPLDDGGWAMTWGDYHNSRYEVWLQAFDKSGEARGRAILVDRNASSNGYGPQITALDDGQLAVVWDSYRKQGSTDTEIKQEIFSPVTNHAPIANGEKITVGEDQKVRLDVLANDQDEDGDKLTVDSVSVVSGQADIAFDEDGTVTLRKFDHRFVDGETGTVVVRYKIYDGSEYNTANIKVTVNGITSPGDEIHGTAKDDVIVGKNFREQLFGETGNDKINGRGGRDHLYGGDGDDTLIGGKGDDKFVGGRGNDILVGGDYDDDDTFVFNRRDGNDTIQNLRNGKIDLSALHEFRDFQDLRNHIHQHNDSLVIDLVGNNSITLEHQSLDLLWHQNIVL